MNRTYTGFHRYLMRILLPLLLIAVMTHAAALSWLKAGCTNAATGTITEVVLTTGKRDTDDGIIRYDLYKPVITYTVDGKHYENRFQGATEPIWETGQEVGILYNPSLPTIAIFPEEHEIYVRQFSTGHMLAMGFVGIIQILIAAGFGTFLDKKRMKKAMEKHDTGV